MKTLSATFISILFACLGVSASSEAGQSYADVVVIINSNSAVSEQIGTYFAGARNLPIANIIRVSAPVTEEIDSLQFENLRTQIEHSLIANNLVSSINYIVTTKGMPLKVLRGNTNPSTTNSSSVESDLCLILGPYASSIGKNSYLYSPYYGKRQDFSSGTFGFYLVTRLDGYTYDDVKTLIDKATQVDSTTITKGTFVFDEDPLVTASAYLNTYMEQSGDQLAQKNIAVRVDATTEYLTHINHVLGYVSWGSNDHSVNLYTDQAKPYDAFLPGAVAETFVSTSARSFTIGTTYGQSLIADLIAEGVTGVKGYVYEPYSVAMADPRYLFPMYADGYTLAESYYASSRCLSWMDVVIGDPKVRISEVRGAFTAPVSVAGLGTTLPVELTDFTAAACRNAIALTWSTATESNNAGFEIQRRASSSATWHSLGFVDGSGSSAIQHHYTFTDRTALAGTYAYRLKQIDRDGAFEFSKEVCVTAAESIQQPAKLIGNYPNPFNPQTTLTFQLSQSGTASVKVFNTVGQEVATLVNGEMEAGEYDVPFNGSNLASGMYIVELRAGGVVSTHKILLTK